MRKCRICGESDFKEVVDFGQNPLVNSLIEEKDLSKKEGVFPLVVEQCQKCSLVQIVDPIDANKIYRDEDYLYFSGDMPGLSDYFREYAEDLISRFVKPDDFVVEIGSNDGTMLRHFKESLFDVLGIDPSSNVVARALKNGIPTISDFFTERLAKSVAREFGKAKLVYGNNCIAHIHDLHEVMRGVKALLADDGVFAVECNYWGRMVKNKNYALIYHDHFSYFTVKNWLDIAERYGMRVFDATITPAQGGSLRVFLSNDKGVSQTERLITLLDEEVSSNLASYETCLQYRKDIEEEARKLKEIILRLKELGKRIAGYGCAAKGLSVLKFAGITNELDYFVDDSEAKQGKYTPITHIPVINRSEANPPDYFLITAPNYEKQIVEKEQEFLAQGGHFLTVDGREI